MSTKEWEGNSMTEQEYYLAHHGVKGMKWGVRKDKKRRAREEYDREVEAKRDELDRRAHKEYRKSYAHRVEKKMDRDGVYDADSAEPYWQNYDKKRDSHALKSEKAANQAAVLQKNYVRNATIGKTLVMSAYGIPAALFISNKIVSSKNRVVSGKAKVLGYLAGAAAGVTVGAAANAAVAAAERRRVEKELGIESVRKRMKRTE